jgi:hypothetical protein
VSYYFSPSGKILVAKPWGSQTLDSLVNDVARDPLSNLQRCTTAHELEHDVSSPSAQEQIELLLRSRFGSNNPSPSEEPKKNFPQNNLAGISLREDSLRQCHRRLVV